MANVVQWSVEQFYAQLQVLAGKIKAVEAALNADKLELQQAWSRTKTDANRARALANQALLQPQIHRNSVLRLTYLAPVKAKFHEAVNLSRSALGSVGINAPTLSGDGLGFAVVIAPAAAATIVVVALAAIGTVALLTDAQRTRTHALARALDKAKTADEVKSILDANTRNVKAEEDAYPPLGLDLGKLTPILALVAALVFAPTLMTYLPKRAAA